MEGRLTEKLNQTQASQIVLAKRSLAFVKSLVLVFVYFVPMHRVMRITIKSSWLFHKKKILDYFSQVRLFSNRHMHNQVKQ